MSHVIVVTICPAAVAHGAEFAHPFTRKLKTLSAHNTYGRLQRTERRDNAKPGDVLSRAASALFPLEETCSK